MEITRLGTYIFKDNRASFLVQLKILEVFILKKVGNGEKLKVTILEDPKILLERERERERERENLYVD